ncbi:MAG: hypothetical protein V7744_06265 [Pseudomonadales bacterium]
MNNLMIDDSIHTQLASLAEQFIPQRSGDALYLRPFMIGVDANLNLGASQVYEFIVIASPRLASPRRRRRQLRRAIIMYYGWTRRKGSSWKSFLAIQESRQPDILGWNYPVPKKSVFLSDTVTT